MNSVATICWRYIMLDYLGEGNFQRVLLGLPYYDRSYLIGPGFDVRVIPITRMPIPIIYSDSDKITTICVHKPSGSLWAWFWPELHLLPSPICPNANRRDMIGKFNSLWNVRALLFLQCSYQSKWPELPLGMNRGNHDHVHLSKYCTIVPPGNAASFSVNKIGSENCFIFRNWTSMKGRIDP